MFTSFFRYFLELDRLRVSSSLLYSPASVASLPPFSPFPLYIRPPISSNLLASFFFNRLLTFSLLPLTSPAAFSPFFFASPCHQCPLLIDGSFTSHWRSWARSSLTGFSGVRRCWILFLALFFALHLFGKHLFCAELDSGCDVQKE